MTGSWLEKELTESGGQINSGEDGASGLADVADAFYHVLHGMLVCVCVESLEVLHQLDASIAFGNGKDGAIKGTLGRLDDTQFQPLDNVFFYFLSMGRRILNCLT